MASELLNGVRWVCVGWFDEIARTEKPTSEGVENIIRHTRYGNLKRNETENCAWMNQQQRHNNDVNGPRNAENKVARVRAWVVKKEKKKKCEIAKGRRIEWQSERQTLIKEEREAVVIFDPRPIGRVSVVRSRSFGVTRSRHPNSPNGDKYHNWWSLR